MSDPSLGTVDRPAGSGAWRWAVLIALAVVVAMGLLVGRIANATSYLSDESTTCLNCHVMTNAYATWERGSHGRFTVCNDCHVPHDSTAAKLAFKGLDGMKHSYVFTMRQEPQVLRLSEGAIRVVQNNCIRCHTDQLSMIRVAGTSERRCWDCHSNIHGKARSLSASPHVRRPSIPPAGLKWLIPDARTNP